MACEEREDALREAQGLPPTTDDPKQKKPWEDGCVMLGCASAALLVYVLAWFGPLWASLVDLQQLTPWAWNAAQAAGWLALHLLLARFSTLAVCMCCVAANLMAVLKALEPGKEDAEQRWWEISEVRGALILLAMELLILLSGQDSKGSVQRQLLLCLLSIIPATVGTAESRPSR